VRLVCRRRFCSPSRAGAAHHQGNVKNSAATQPSETSIDGRFANGAALKRGLHGYEGGPGFAKKSGTANRSMNGLSRYRIQSSNPGVLGSRSGPRVGTCQRRARLPGRGVRSRFAPLRLVVSSAVSSRRVRAARLQRRSCCSRFQRGVHAAEWSVAFLQIHAILQVSLDRLLGLRFLSLLEPWRRSALRLVVSFECSELAPRALAQTTSQG
jgi:hypothetical protein